MSELGYWQWPWRKGMGRVWVRGIRSNRTYLLINIYWTSTMNQILLEPGAKPLFLFSLMLQERKGCPVKQTPYSSFFPAWPSRESLLLSFLSFYPTYLIVLVLLPICLQIAGALVRREIMSSSRDTEVHAYAARHRRVTLYTCYFGLTDFIFAQTVNWQLVFIYSLSPRDDPWACKPSRAGGPLRMLIV